jgi:hypothetical protein
MNGSATAVRAPLTRRAARNALLSIVAGTTLFTASPAGAAPTDPAAPTGSASTGSPQDAEKSLVFLQTYWQGYVEFPMDGEWYRSDDPVEIYTGQCSGWFASEQGHIVTAGHCVDDDGVRELILEEFLTEYDALDLLPEAIDSWEVLGTEGESEPTRIVMASQPSTVDGAVLEDRIAVQVIDWQSPLNGDLALLKANQLPEAAPPLAVATDAPSIGDEVTAMGYPGSVQKVSDVDRLHASFKTGTVSSIQTSATGVAQTEINAQVSGGMSGGPTTNADGAVIGVNSFGVVGEEESFNFITDNAALRSYLERQGVDVEIATTEVEAAPAGDTLPAGPAAAPSAAGGGLPSWSFLAGGGVLVLLAGGAFLLTRPGAGQRAAAPAFAGSAGHPVRSDATRWIDRRVPVVPAGPACSHAGNGPGARFCGDCGSRLTD